MKPPFAYYGGKTRLADWIVAMLPRHRVYVEPFAGSAAVLLAKPYRATHEVLNDRDELLVNFFRVLRTMPDELELACRLTPYSRSEYAAADLTEPGLTDLELARRWWVRASQSFGAVGAAGTGWSSSVKRGSNTARSTWNRLERFRPLAERLGTVTIENRDACDVIVDYSAVDGVIYCDPPYLGATRSSFAGGRRPAGDYAHEFHTEEDHRRLAEVLHASPATVLLSGYPDPLYEELYGGWHRVERNVVRRSSTRRAARLPWATEVVWSNRPLQQDLFGTREASS